MKRYIIKQHRIVIIIQKRKYKSYKDNIGLYTLKIKHKVNFKIHKTVV